MAKLVFKVASDWEEVVRLRTEIGKLKNELKGMDSTQSPAAFKALNTQLSASTQRMDELVNEAAKAGAVMEGDFKKKIFDASQSVNGLTERIIAQKAVVKDVEADVKRLGDAYRSALKNNPLSANSKLSEYTSAKKALDEEKASLFGLTQQQAEARLSVKKLRDEYSLYKDEAKETVEANNGIAVSWKRALAVIGGATALKAFGSEMIRVRGQFQAADTAIQTLLGSKEKADKLMAQVREYAKISPLEFSDVTSATQMMLGFNIEAEKVPRYLQAIGDVSMGDTQSFNSLTLAFSQMTAAGKLMGQDLNQMINAGFNPLQIMAEKTGKSIATLKDEMSKGAISAEMVQQAFIDATSAGGKFFGMSENASKTINGQLSMMRDTMDNAFNEMGQKSEGVIMKGIQMTTSLIQNYETVGKVLAGLIATYGTYRTALMLSTVATSKLMSVELSLNRVRALARISQMALNKAVSANPYVLAATALMGLVSSLYIFSDTTSVAEKAQKNFNNSIEYQKILLENLKKNIDQYVSIVRDETLSQYDKIKAYEQLKELMPTVFSNMDIEKLKLMDILSLNEQISNEIAKRERIGAKTSLVLRQKELESVSLRLDNAVERQAQSPTSQNSAVITKLQQEKKRLEKEAELAKKNVDEIIELQNKTKKTEKDSNYKQDYEKAQKDWEDAKKKLSEIEKDKSKFTSKQFDEAKKRVETTEKAYKDLGGITGSSLSNQENQAEKLRKEQDKFNVLLDKQSIEQQRSAEDMQMKVDEARIKAMDEGSAKTIAEMKLNFEKEMQAIDRQKEDALRKKIEDARDVWDANPKNANKSFDGSGIKLTDDEQKSFDELYRTAIISNEKIYKDLAERYLSYADERLAIEKKFNDDISILQEARKKAETKGDASEIAQIDRSIEKRTEIKNEDIFKLDAEQFKKNMNWEQVFGNLDKVSTDTLKKLKANLKDFISSQKDLSPENLKELVDAIERIDDKVSERDPFETMSISFKSLKEVTDAQREAQKAYNKALEEGTDEEKKNAKATLESAKNSKQKALYEATDALHKGINEIGQYVDAGNQVIGIMETLGIKTPEWMEGTMSGFGEMLNGLGNIDLMKPMSIITGSLQTVKGALTSVISLGGLIPGLGGADYSHYNEMVEEYNKLNEIWDELIDKKLEYINTSYGAEADKVGKEALELVNKSIEAYRILGRERLNSGASAGSHSIGKRMVKNTSSSDWQDIADALDMSVKDAKDFIGTGRMTGLFDLTTEQLEKLKSEAPTFWAKLDGDVRDYLDKIIEGEERIEEIHNQINEQLTQTTFDGVYSNFIDTLMDMKASSKDAAEDVSEYFMQAMLSEQIGTLYQDKLKKWYEKFAKGMEDGSLTESERNALNSEYMGYIEEAMKLRDELAAATGYDKISQESTSQSASSKGFQAMSQDTGEELNGRFTALQIAGEEIKNQNIIQSQSLNLLTVKADALLSINTETRNIADDTRNLIAQSYLELVQISENTGAIVKPIQQMQRDIAEVKKNTAKL